MSEERIRQLQILEADKGEDDEIDLGARERYRELAETILAWDLENAQLFSVSGGSSKVRTTCDIATGIRYGLFKLNVVLQRFLNGNSHSPNMPFGDLSLEEPERTKVSASTSAALSRHADDVGEF